MDSVLNPVLLCGTVAVGHLGQQAAWPLKSKAAMLLAAVTRQQGPETYSALLPQLVASAAEGPMQVSMWRVARFKPCPQHMYCTLVYCTDLVGCLLVVGGGSETYSASLPQLVASAAEEPMQVSCVCVGGGIRQLQQPIV